MRTKCIHINPAEKGIVQTRLLNHRPLASFAAGLCAGILLAGRLNGTQQLAAACCFCAFWAWAALTRRPALLLLAAGFACGMLRMGLCKLLPALALASPFEGLRSRLVGATIELFGKHGPLLGSMLWGERSGAQLEHFRTAGIAHVFALSGLHVSIIAGAIARLVKRRRPRLVASVAFLMLYCGVAAFPASLVRAAVMSLCLIIGGISGRPRDTLSSLSFAAIIILIAAPEQLHEAGFQLSFTAVATIAMLRAPLCRRLRRLGHAAAESASMAVCGMLGTLPLTAWHFGSVSVLGLFANLLMLPLVPAIVLCGLAAVLLGLAWPAAATLPRAVALLLLTAMDGTSALIASVPGATLATGPFSAWACVAFYLALFCLSRYPLLSGRQKLGGGCAFGLLSIAIYLLA